MTFLRTAWRRLRAVLAYAWGVLAELHPLAYDEPDPLPLPPERLTPDGVAPIDPTALVAALTRAREAEARVRAYHCLGVLLAIALATIVALTEALRATGAQ